MADASGYDPRRDPNWVREDYDPDAILADPNAHIKHKVYAAINIGIRDRGERWAKCANCGDPYMLTEEWDNGTICSRSCEREFAADLGLEPTDHGTYRTARPVSTDFGHPHDNGLEDLEDERY